MERSKITLNEIVSRGYLYHIEINQMPPKEVEVEQDGVERSVLFSQSLITLMVYDPNRLIEKSGDPMIVAKVKATGVGETQRDSELDGIEEALRRTFIK